MGATRRTGRSAKTGAAPNWNAYARVTIPQLDWKAPKDGGKVAIYHTAHHARRPRDIGENFI